MQTHTPTHTHTHTYIIVNSVEKFCISVGFFSENGNCDKTFILQFLSIPYVHAATISGVYCTS